MNMNNCDCVNCTEARAIAVSNALLMTIKLNCQSAVEAELALSLALADLISGNDSTLDVAGFIERFHRLYDDSRQRRSEQAESVNAAGGVG